MYMITVETFKTENGKMSFTTYFEDDAKKSSTEDLIMSIAISNRMIEDMKKEGIVNNHTTIELAKRKIGVFQTELDRRKVRARRKTIKRRK